MAALNSSKILVKDSIKDMADELANRLEQAANAAIERDGNFKVGLTGGSLVSLLSEALGKIRTDWSKWLIFFCDERILTDMEPLHKKYENLFKQLNIPIPTRNLIKVETTMSPRDSSENYTSKLALYFSHLQFPRFHCLLLGVGSDGHICSLFPNDNEVLSETCLWVAPVVDAPKLPSCRVTITFPVINNAELCIFAASGAEKCDVIKKVFEGCDVPAAKVKLARGTVLWILDRNAAPKCIKQISNQID